ncbi:uncharacterized protein CBL_02127 [Carabus blaptoides fortunei]
MAKKVTKKKAKPRRTTVHESLTEEDRELIATVTARLKEKWDTEDAEKQQTMKKKLTKKDKARLAARRAEELKQAVEQERLRLIEEEKKRQEEERKAAIEKEIRDKVEQTIRLDQLADSCAYIRKLKRKYLKVEADSIARAEWEQYMKCDGLPDPSSCGQMNTYLHLWDKVKEETTIEQASTKSQEVLSLLEMLDDFLDCPAVSGKQKEEWLTVRNSFRTYQEYNLDCAAYRLLRDIHKHLNRVDIPTATYVREDQHFKICLWVLVQLPIPMPNPKKPPRPRTTLTFPELNLEILFPETMDIWAMCVRAMYVAYDHYSYMCRSYDAPGVPAELLQDLNEVTKCEWTEKLAAKSNARDAQPVQPEPVDVEDDTAVARRQREFIQVDASAIYIRMEDSQYAAYREQLFTQVTANEVNLRRYRIIGGVYYLSLIYQPPQPSTLVLQDITLSTLHLPKWLANVPFHIQYQPPAAPEPGVTRKPEEIEADLKKQEQEYDRLVYVTLALTSTVLWLDVPVVCQWDADRRIWSTENIHDVKHNEEKQIVQFRTGKFGPFAMALFKYSSMPYQAWEMKPTNDGRVIFTIMAAVLIIEFTVHQGEVCVSQLQNAPNDALDSIIGVYYKLAKLKRLLHRGGVDVFPAADAFCYTDGVCEKHWPMEHHLYYNMAQCAMYYNFSWSRWNLLAGRRRVVMQIREWSASERVKLPNYSMLMVTPLRALLVDCTEVSQTFTEQGVARMKFYSDLYHLITGISSISMKQKIQNAPADLVNTVAQLLDATRIPLRQHFVCFLTEIYHW